MDFFCHLRLEDLFKRKSTRKATGGVLLPKATRVLVFDFVSIEVFWNLHSLLRVTPSVPKCLLSLQNENLKMIQFFQGKSQKKKKKIQQFNRYR